MAPAKVVSGIGVLSCRSWKLLTLTTVGKAIDAQKSLLKVFIDLAIWLIVLVLPYAIVIGVIVWLVARIQRWMQRKMPSDIRSQNKPPDPM